MATFPSAGPLTPRHTSPLASPSTPPPPQPILTTGSVPSEVSLLFRTKRVSEIRQFEARIRDEANDKSDALRQLLGTRYRDLLLSADRITTMRDAATLSVRDALHSVSSVSSSLRDDLVTRTGPPTSPHFSHPASPTGTDADLVRRRSVHAVGSRLKHIVDSPEVLYACLEAGDLYDAATRFVLAERNYRVLLDAPTQEEGVANKFAHARWSLVASFRNQILTAAQHQLVTADLPVMQYAEVLATIIVLTAACDVVSVVEGMLASRTTWLNDERQRATPETAQSMRAVATVVRRTVSFMAHLFWIQGDHSVETLVRVIDPSAAELVRTARNHGGLNGAVIAWTANVRAWLYDNGDAMLAGAATSRQVADTLRAVDDVFTADGWDADCKAALQQGPEFVFDIFKPFISARAAVVAEQCVDSAIRTVLKDIQTAWADVDGSLDVGKVMWSAISSQAVGLGDKRRDGSNGFRKPRKEDEENDVRRMLTGMGAVSGLVNTFDRLLTEALTDVRDLTQRVPSVSTAFDAAVRSRIPVILNDLQKRVETIAGDNEDGKETLVEMAMQRALFVSRTATAISTADSVSHVYGFLESGGEGQPKRNGALEELQQRAEHVSNMAYGAWAQLLCQRLGKQLLKELTEDKVLVIEMGWSSGYDANAEIEGEVGDGDMNVVRIPTAASTGIVNMLLGACKASSGAGGFGLPMEAVQKVRDEITVECARAYRLALDEYVSGYDGTEEVKYGNFDGMDKDNADRAVMQLLFDVQCIQILLGEGGLPRGKAALADDKGVLKKVEGEVQARIDPIDLASCRKVLHESVNGYVARTSTLFGPIARRRDGRSVWMGSVRTVSSGSMSANLVSLCQSVPRFTYLPAPMPSTYSSGGVGTAGLNAKAAVGALRNETSSVAVHAAVNMANRKRETADTSVAGYASKVSESVGRLGRGFFESLTRQVA